MAGFFRPISKRLLVALVCAGALTQGAAAAEFVSAYTKHDFEKCAARPSPHPDVVTVKACDGLAGIKLVWTSEPDASSIAFGKPVGETIPGLDTFFEVRGTIEWRGPSAGGTVKPVAAIVRYDTGPSIGRLGSSRLVVYKLAAKGPSCVMGVIRGSTPDANARARDLADRKAEGFVCGKSPIIR